MDKWFRLNPGVYETEDGNAAITLIPAHWELAVTANPEQGIEPWTADYATLSEAQAWELSK